MAAVTENLYTGNGTTVLYPFTFPYIDVENVRVSINDVDTTSFTLSNPTTVQLNTAPANGSKIRIYRRTDNESTAATFYPGSAIRAQDLNDNFTQSLYVSQESINESTSAVSTALTAKSTANSALSASATAVSTANSAVTTANTANTSAASAVSTANTAATTASTASTNATAAVNAANNAVSTANSASAAATAATNTANAATAAATTASSNASAAVSTANSALSAANSAVTTANNASTTASAASTAASNAVSTANAAATTATTANNKADQAINAVANAILYDFVANVAAIPASPVNNDAVEVFDSTGIQSFSPLAGKPVGFTGSSGLSVRMVYSSAGNTWNWVQYFPNDPETRYLKFSGGTLTGPLTLSGAPTSNLHPATKAYVDGYVSAINGDIASLASTKLDSSTAASTYQTQAGMSAYLTTAHAASTYAPLSSPTFTGTVTIPSGALIAGYLTTSTAASTYLTQANAASTYQTQAGMASYLTTASAGSTYLTQANAASTYQTQAGMSSYLTTSSASSTYRAKSDLNKVDTSIGLSFFMSSF